jgi:large subunit ribosomal protein L31
MQKNIQPQLNPVVFVDLNTKDEHITKSTLTSDKTKTIDGVKHYVIEVEITSSSHPFYTGKHRIVDTENLVKKFEKKQKKAEKLSDKLKKSKEKKKKRNTKKKKKSIKASKKLTLKDMLNKS